MGFLCEPTHPRFGGARVFQAPAITRQRALKTLVHQGRIDLNYVCACVPMCVCATMFMGNNENDIFSVVTILEVALTFDHSLEEAYFTMTKVSMS